LQYHENVKISAIINHLLSSAQKSAKRAASSVDCVTNERQPSSQEHITY